jgi:hypothetical protein
MRGYICGMTPIVPMPQDIEVLSEGGTTVLRKRWWSWAVLFLVFFCVFWNGFMVVWFGTALKQGRWEMAAFGTLHALIGIGLAYFVLASFVNKTDVVISPGEVRVKTHPLPWPGNKSFSPADISQLYTKEVLHRTKNGTSHSYQVHVIDRAGREHKLLAGLQSSEQGLFIEKTVEQQLGLSDQPVRGEIPR